ncbi:MAG: hypothetical protein R6V55_12770 [Desulfovermiculus sp.]
MNLFKQSHFFVIWFAQVMRTFLQVHPWTTVGVVAMAAGSRIAYVLATFMPFKVVLLAGSSGVPRYFQFFMAPEHKEIWIVILAVGTVICYITSVVLDALTERLSETGSAKVLQQAEVIPYLNNQQDVARAYYAKFCRISADAVFVGAGVLTGLIVNFSLFLVVIGLISLLFILSAILLKTADHIHPRAAAVYIQNNLGNYIKTLTSVAFLLSFLFLLILFLLFGYANVLGAILSIVIIRQTLTALTSIVKDAVSLGKAQHQINALTFRDVQFQQKENPIEKARRILFNKSAREALVKKELSQLMHLQDNLEVHWLDPVIPGVDCFAIAVQTNHAAEHKHFLQQVFPPKQYQKLEHEHFLFKHIQREAISAPAQISFFHSGQFQCQICDYGAGMPVPKSQWKDVESMLIERIWSCPPPSELVRVYAASTPLLPHRLTDELIAGLEIAVDTREEEQKLRLLNKYVPQMRARLHSMPLYVYNPDFNKNNVVQDPNTDFLIMVWCRWSLEPLGAGMTRSTMGQLRRKGLNELLGKVSRSRSDMTEDIVLEDVALAAWCFDLEYMITKKKYKAGLKLLEKILLVWGSMTENTELLNAYGPVTKK